MASVSTHFTTYRASALGIAIAGSSLGGVVFPIVLQHLFETEGIGFGWGVRVVGFVSLVGCGVAVLTVTASRVEVPDVNVKEGREEESSHSLSCVWWRAITDVRFILLVMGSAFVALGESIFPENALFVMLTIF
jgi:hypothetical protein